MHARLPSTQLGFSIVNISVLVLLAGSTWLLLTFSTLATHARVKGYGFLSPENIDECSSMIVFISVIIFAGLPIVLFLNRYYGSDGK